MWGKKKRKKKILLQVNEKSCWPCPWHVMKTCTGAGCCSDIFIISFIVCSLHPKRLGFLAFYQWKTAHNVVFSIMNWATSQPVLPVSILNQRSHKGRRLLSLPCSQSAMLWSLKLCMKGTNLTRVHVRWKYSSHVIHSCVIILSVRLMQAFMHAFGRAFSLSAKTQVVKWKALNSFKLIKVLTWQTRHW